MRPKIDFRQCEAIPFLESLEGNSLRAIITDPPYDASKGSSFTGDYNTIKEAWDDLPDPLWIELAYAKLMPGGSLVSCGSIHNALYLLEYARNAGFRSVPHQKIVWVKVSVAPARRKRLTYQHEDIWWWVKPGAPYTFNPCYDGRGRKVTDVWLIQKTSPREKLYDTNREALHPTQKPQELGRRLVEIFTGPGDMVCDCFAGTGTFLYMAARLGRTPIGCESDDKYYEPALARIERGISESKHRRVEASGNGRQVVSLL